MPRAMNKIRFAWQLAHTGTRSSLDISHYDRRAERKGLAMAGTDGG